MNRSRLLLVPLIVGADGARGSPRRPRPRAAGIAGPADGGAQGGVTGWRESIPQAPIAGVNFPPRAGSSRPS